MTNDAPWTVRRVLDWTINYLKEHASETPRLDAEVLLAYARRCQRIQLYTQFDLPLSEQERALMRSLVKRRAANEPVAYLVGHREFFSLDFEIEKEVFIPRPDTETLVAATLDLLKNRPHPQVLELCTGSGCIPIALAKNHPTVQLTTVEKKPTPFAVAQRNITKHGMNQRIQLLQGDLFSPLPPGTKYDLIVSNPPYVSQTELKTLEADVRDHEPMAALDGGEDGLDIIRLLINEAPHWLRQGGWLLFELSREQVPVACSLMQHQGFQKVTSEADLSGHPRVVLGCWVTS